MKQFIITVCCIGMTMVSAGLLCRAEEEGTPAIQQEPLEQKMAAPEQPLPALEVVKSVTCETVENREPSGEKTIFPGGTEKVYFWTEITGAQQPTQIRHVWYHESKQIADVPLTIQYPRHRTWSYKTILPELAGSWSVEVIGPDGTILKKTDFSVGSSGQVSPETQESTMPETPGQEREEPAQE